MWTAIFLCLDELDMNHVMLLSVKFTFVSIQWWEEDKKRKSKKNATTIYVPYVRVLNVGDRKLMEQK